MARAPQWMHTPKHCREYGVPIQEVVRRATLGAEPRYATHRSAGELRRPQSHDAVGDAPNGARVMIKDLPRVNCS